jgi:hypothetical protein
MPQNPWTGTAHTVKALSDALERYDWEQARVICSELVATIDTAAEVYPEQPAKQILIPSP